MHFKFDFESNSEISAYITLTNKYAIVGRSESTNTINFLREKLNFPVVETTVANIKTIGNLCVGNSNGLILSGNTNDSELMHIRNSLPESIRVVRIYEKCNALGNNVLANDHVAIVNPELSDDSVQIISEVLKVPTYKMTLGQEHLVGSFGAMNSTGLVVHPDMNSCEIKELSDLLSINCIASTINQGSKMIGAGMVVNDFLCITGRRTTNVEMKVAEKVFGFGDNLDERAVIEEVVF